ncbi:Replication factor C subunit 1 [Aphelenchoides besseyi]|nr:Replication factor C subunit 1 [Aphelenchoides besseyi]KAI6200118.1 Replication factor C subunit 1 [Aphelenchoides besseyi]
MSRDIRRYLTPIVPSKPIVSDAQKRKLSEKTAITNEANCSVTPPPIKRPKPAKIDGQVVTIDLDSDGAEDDSEEPLSLKFRKTSKNKRVIMSDDDETENIEITEMSLTKKEGLSNVQQVSFPSVRKPATKLEQWVDKYQPADMSTIIGQHTDQAPTKKLLRWLKEWPRHNLGQSATAKKPKTNAASIDGSSFRAALLSGPPGIGKTTSARLVCKELNLHYIEMNASDARSKKLLEQRVKEMLHSQKIADFFGGTANKGKVVSKSGHKITSVLIMDEVDGMSGSQDRSGITELIAMINKTEIPIICICNDRQSKKIRSLANHCFDLRYSPPTVQMILGRMMTILYRENLKATREDIEKVIQASNQDIRQSIYSLQLLAAGQNKLKEVVFKDCAVNTFEAARRLLSTETNLIQKRDLFFMDYTLMPLFVQEMYLNVRNGKLNKMSQLKVQAKAAESIALGEIVSREIRRSQNWTLLPFQGMMSCTLPPLYLNGRYHGQIMFPQFLGKSSNERKRQRLLNDLQTHAGIRMSGPRHAIAADYIPLLRHRIIQPLLGNEPDIEESIEVYHAYEMIREDFETINELGMWNENDDKWKRVAATTKSALTRALNNDTFKFSYATDNGIQIFAKEDISESAKGKRKTGKRAAANAAKQKIKDFTDEIEENFDEIDEDPEVMAEILNA